LYVCALCCLRFMTCCCVLDYNTVAAADKFGNLAIVSMCTHSVLVRGCGVDIN